MVRRFCDICNEEITRVYKINSDIILAGFTHIDLCYQCGREIGQKFKYWKAQGRVV